MNIRTRILLATLAITAPLLNPSAHAFGGPPGGPFSNGSYFPNDGTFSAVVRGRPFVGTGTLVGTVQFSTSSGSGPVPSSSRQETTNTAISTTQSTTTSSGLGGVGSTGVATMYYIGGEGENNIAGTYTGNSQGSYNGKDSSLTVTFQADMPGQGEQTIEVQTPVTVDVPNVITQNGTTTVITTQETEFVPTKKIIYFDSFYLSGSAECKTSNSFPNQKFQGDGTALIKYINFPAITGASPVFETESLKIDVTGVRLSNTAASFNQDTVTPPSFNQFTILEE